MGNSTRSPAETTEVRSGAERVAPFRSEELSNEAFDLLQRLAQCGYLCWNGHKMEGAAHELIMLGYAEGRRPPRHRNWYIDITPDGRAALERDAAALLKAEGK